MDRRPRRPTGAQEGRNTVKEYTLREANRSLALVRPIVRDVVRYYKQVLDCQEALEACRTGGSREQFEQAQRDALYLVDRLGACGEELAQLGVELKDWATGLVDFPAMAAGRHIRLCWHLGEDRIGHWHDSGDDCGQRTELSSLLAEVERV